MEQTNPKPFVFVLMPFDMKFKDHYEVGIKAACEAAGAYCERVDEQQYEGQSILERIYKEIAKADIIVSVMTAQNPNVFYETGYAHALNKQVLLLTEDAKDIPFDLKHSPHIVYGETITELKKKLERSIRWCIENPKRSISEAELSIKCFVDGISLEERPTIHLKTFSSATHNYSVLKIDIQNVGKSLINESTVAGLVIPEEFLLSMTRQVLESIEYYKFPDGRCMITMPISGKRDILPDGWGFFKLDMYTVKSQVLPLDVILKIFTMVGPKEYPFTIIRKGVETVLAEDTIST